MKNHRKDGQDVGLVSIFIKRHGIIGLRKCWQPSYWRRVVCADSALCLALALSSWEPSLATRALRLASPASATRPGVRLVATTWDVGTIMVNWLYWL